MDISRFNDLVNERCESLPKLIQTEPLPLENVVMGIFEALTNLFDVEKTNEHFELLMLTGPGDLSP